MRTKEEDLELFYSILDRWKSGDYLTNLRKGQALFVLMHDVFPYIISSLNDTRFDCFNLDSRIDSFVEKVKSMIQEEPTETIDIEDLSDEELLFLVEEIDSLHVAEDSLLRKIALQAFNAETTMDFIRVGMLILPIIAERMKHYSPHITK